MSIPIIVGILSLSITSLRVVFKALLLIELWLYDLEILPLPYRYKTEID